MNSAYDVFYFFVLFALVPTAFVTISFALYMLKGEKNGPHDRTHD
jgi:hypothetical protein